ncbi:MAG: LysR family transcriptional regulator [Bdellovibrionales bacterium]
MDLNLLKIFIKVAETGSLTKASKVLNFPKSKLSRHLDRLELELEEVLMIRSPRGVVLTEQGRNLLRKIKVRMDDLESAITEMKSDSKKMQGKVKLTAPEDVSYYLLSPLIIEFMSMYPDVEIELYSTNTFLDFNEHNIDLALRIGKLEDSNLIQRKISDIEVSLIGSAQYLKSSPKIDRLSDLSQHTFAIMRDIYGNPMHKEIIEYGSPSFSSNSIPVLLNFIATDKGLATIPKFICPVQIAKGEFQVAIDSVTSSKRSLYILTRPANFTANHVKVFKDFLYENLKREF